MASRVDPLSAVNPMRTNWTNWTIRVRVVRLENKGNFRLSNHDYKVIFQFRTMVIPATDDGQIQRYGFEWRSTKSILSGEVDPATLIGSCKHEREQCKGSGRENIESTITDLAASFFNVALIDAICHD
ncbi:replication protein A 70 kDa DNA-binding subunit A-like [Senna tora]|uniref:Replication protein A 70 kDa DNA-binding subunit A-like n=1 Tax=Senna tora TaxID=362788 RepID=A0A834WZD7_9FABA|nr:replication protein A 70 kDa DNA-binding subunit A-like [Senna tora]